MFTTKKSQQIDRLRLMTHTHPVSGDLILLPNNRYIIK